MQSAPRKRQLFEAVLINLDCDAERLSWMETQLNKVQLAFQRQSAVLARNGLPSDVARFFPPRAPLLRRPLGVGEVGCYASHLMAMQRVASGEFGDCALIMEDDLAVSIDIVPMVNEALGKLPPGWDLLRLSNPPKCATKPVARLANGRSIVAYSKIPNSTGAYVLSVNGARKLLKSVPRVLPIDNDLQRCWRFDLRQYGIVPAPVRPDAFRTSSITIQQNGLTTKKSRALQSVGRIDLIYILSRPIWNARYLGIGVWLRCLIVNGWRKVARRVWPPGPPPLAERHWVTEFETVGNSTDVDEWGAPAAASVV